MVVPRLDQAEQVLNYVVVDLWQVKVVHCLCKVKEKLHMFTPPTDVAFDVLAKYLQLGQQLLVDYL